MVTALDLFPTLDEQAERNIAGVRYFADGRGLLFEGDAHAWAVFSPCRTYRYLLGRQWDASKPCARFTMLNPSVAGGLRSDPTAAKVRGFSERLGCGSYIAGNLAALVSTDPRGMLAHGAPIGPLNGLALDMLLSDNSQGPLIAAWGRFPSKRIATLLAEHASGVRDRQPWCYGTTKDGQPRHPLMLAYSTPLVSLADGRSFP